MSYGTIETNIKSIVSDLQKVSWQQVINEAITNSLQAVATDIQIKFISNSLDFQDKLIDSITVQDNGKGFDEVNTKSFQEYKTPLKKDLGCKGTGRFFYLKYFNSVQIRSLDKQIDFSMDKNINISLLESQSQTTLYLKQPKKKILVDYQQYRLNLYNHFLAYFKLLNDNKVYVTLSIYENSIKQFDLISKDIPSFQTKKFAISKHNFILDYIINDENILTDGFYCAGQRVVIQNNHLESNKKLQIYKNIKIFYLLSSEYFNNNVNEARDDFSIYPKKKDNDLFNNLSWNEIQSEVKEQIKIISKENGIDIDKISNIHKQKALEEAPFLAYYLQKNDNNLDSESLKKYAVKMLEKDKEFIRNHKDILNYEYQEKLSIITQSELAEYIYDRQKIIDRLKILTDQNSLEKELHNLFMKQHTQDKSQNYKSNYLWLFDDRFMSYDKVFSESQLKEIFPELINNLERPDILSIGEMSIISNTFEKDNITDIVIIELKKASEKITPARAEEQLIDYAGYINEAYENRNVRIWTYAFLKFNDKTERSLTNKGYNKVFTKSKYPIYYYPFNNVNTIVNFVDYYAIADDANNRNKVFMKILSGDSYEK